MKLSLVSGFALSLSACSSLGNAEYHNERERAECTYRVLCGIESSFDDCMANYYFEAEFPIDTAENLAESGRVTYSGPNARDCVKAFPSLTCSWVQYDTAINSKKCAEVFKGALAGQAPCSSGLECQSGVCTPTEACNQLTQCCKPGTCAPFNPPTVVKVGGDCGAPNTVCEDGTYCKSADTKCTKDALEGESCDPDSFACAQGLLCTTDPAGPTCYKPAATGAACSQYVDQAKSCESLLDYCDVIGDGTCKARAAIATPCTSKPCVLGAVCGATAMCDEKKNLGEDCTVTPCNGNLVCSGGGTCVMPAIFPDCYASP